MAVISRSGATTSDLHDQLGSATKQTNSGAGVTATRTYDAFGTLVASAGAPQGPFGFAAASGYQEDGDSGLKLLGHRYYDPSTGRFLTRDPAQDGRNWYAYVDGNPTGDVDEDGLQKRGQGRQGHGGSRRPHPIHGPIGQGAPLPVLPSVAPDNGVLDPYGPGITIGPDPGKNPPQKKPNPPQKRPGPPVGPGTGGPPPPPPHPAPPGWTWYYYKGIGWTLVEN